MSPELFPCKLRANTHEFREGYGGIEWDIYCTWIDEGSKKVDKKEAAINYTDHIVCRECKACQEE